MRYLLVTLAILTCSAEADMSQNLGTVNPNTLGKFLDIPAGTVSDQEFKVLRIELTVPQPLNLVLNSCPAVGAVTDSTGRAIGIWRVTWGSGGGSLQNQILVDGGKGVTIPLHGSIVDVTFITTAAVPVKRQIVAMIAGGAHKTTSLVTGSAEANVNPGNVLATALPFYGKRAQVHRSISAQQCTIEITNDAGVVISEMVWLAGALPFSFDIPNNGAGVSVTNNGAAPMNVSIVFELAI